MSAPLVVSIAVAIAVLAIVVVVAIARRLVRPGPALDVDELARRLGVEAGDLVRERPVYSERYIPKRSGGRRKLLVPDQWTRSLQRKLLKRLFARLRAHHAATAYETRRSIVTNAAPHVGQGVLIKMDLVDFFPRTSADRVTAYYLGLGWTREAAETLTRWTTHEGGLPQGAPTSPRLSNLVNHRLDAAIAAFIDSCGGRYTRYADDIAVSLPAATGQEIRRIVGRLRELVQSYGYVAHGREKLRVLRRHHQQRVTGLVVNERVQLPRATRRWLRAVRHRQRTTGQSTLKPAQLQGWTAYERMIRSG